MTDFRDTVIKLALVTCSSPGVYILLLGSGISRDSRIPISWEITLNLIKKIAAMEREEPKDFEKRI